MKQMPASLETLGSCLDKNPMALHFCGHGIKNNKENFGPSYFADSTQGDYLLFEYSNGAS